MGKHSWIMYVFLLILAVILLKNAAGSVALMLAGGSATGGLITALEGPAPKSSKGSFKFGKTAVTLG